MFGNLLMACVSSLVPGFGLLGNIVEYITSEEKDAGKKFAVNLVSEILPGGFIKDVASGVATDLFFGNRVDEAVEAVVPNNYFEVQCGYCYEKTRNFVVKEGRIFCSRCLSNSIRHKVAYGDPVFVLRNGVYQVRSDLQSKILSSHTYQGQILRGRKLT